MTKHIALFLLLVSLTAAAVAAPAVRNATGGKQRTSTYTAATPTQKMLWDQTAKQLSRAWRGKTREQLLYQIPIVSTKDRIVRAEGKKFYALVEYYQDKEFRKFLFQGQDPQTFITAAATAADVLAVNKKYGINIGLTQELFEQHYGAQATKENAELTDGTVLYKLSYTDVNTPKAQDHWFLFEQATLTQTFYTEADKDAYVASARPTPAETQTPAQTANTQKTNTRNVRTGLISGGTAWDQAYMPRVINPIFQPPQPVQNTKN